MSAILELLRSCPEILLFLAVGLGHLAGRLRIGSFQLGAVSGCLLAGVLVGQLGVAVPPQWRGSAYATGSILLALSGALIVLLGAWP